MDSFWLSNVDFQQVLILLLGDVIRVLACYWTTTDSIIDSTKTYKTQSNLHHSEIRCFFYVSNV